MPGGSSIRVSTTRETQPDERSGAERDPARSGVATSPPGRSTLPRLAHPGFHSKSFLVSFLLPSHQPMKIHRVIPEEPFFRYGAKVSGAAADIQDSPSWDHANHNYERSERY